MTSSLVQLCRRNGLTCLFVGMLLGELLAQSRIDTIAFLSRDSVPLYMTLYTPSSYSTDSLYPVLYLLHGIHGNQYSWEERGHIREMVDSMIADTLIPPIVVAMPLCLVHDTGYFTSVPSYLHAFKDYFRHIKKGEFEPYFTEYENYVNTHYATYTYAVAGLSAGAQQAIGVSANADFSIIGLLSSVLTKKQMRQANRDCLYWIRCGKGDFFYPNTKRLKRYFESQQIAYNFQVEKGAHNWKFWRAQMEEFLLFAFSIQEVK